MFLVICCVTILFKVMMRMEDGDRQEIIKLVENASDEQLKHILELLRKPIKPLHR